MEFGKNLRRIVGLFGLASLVGCMSQAEKNQQFYTGEYNGMEVTISQQPDESLRFIIISGSFLYSGVRDTVYFTVLGKDDEGDGFFEKRYLSSVGNQKNSLMRELFGDNGRKRDTVRREYLNPNFMEAAYNSVMEQNRKN